MVVKCIANLLSECLSCFRVEQRGKEHQCIKRDFTSIWRSQHFAFFNVAILTWMYAQQELAHERVVLFLS